MLRYSCILMLCAVFMHVSSLRDYSRRHTEEEDAKTRAVLKKSLDELKELSQDDNDKYELNELSKMIETADTKTVRFGKRYLQYIKNLIARKKQMTHTKLNASHQRRFLGWFKTLFTPTASTTTSNPKTTTTTTATLRTTTPYVLKATSESSGRVGDINLTETLNKLIDVLYKLNENIQNANNDSQGYYVVRVPISVTSMNANNNASSNRFKRSTVESQTEDIFDNVTRDTVQNQTSEKTTENENNTVTEVSKASNEKYNNTKNIEATQSKLDEVPVFVEDGKRKRYKREVSSPAIDLSTNKINNITEDFQNETTLDSVVTNVTSDLLNKANTRRSFMPQNNIRAKLLSHLYDIIDEIKSKLKPVIRVKNEYGNNVAFKIGYLSANLESLGSNLSRLRMDMEENAHAWGDSKLLEFFDVLQIHRSVVLKLLGSLRSYFNDHSEYSFG